MCRRTVLLGSAALAACAPQPANAQSRWQHQFDAAVEAEHDSNPDMRPGAAAIGVNLVRVAPQVRSRYQSDSDEYELTAGATLERSDKPEVSANRADPHLRAEWRHLSARSRYGAYVLRDERALRAVEVQESVPLAAEGTRILSAVGGDFSHELTEADTLSANLRHDRVRYDVGSLSDYRNAAAGLQFDHALDRLRSAYVRLDLQRYETDDSARSSRSEGLLLGYRTTLSEVLQAEVAAGATRLTGPLGGTDWQGSAKLTYTAARTQLSAELARRINPDPAAAALGSVSIARFEARHSLDETTSVALDLDHGRTHDRQSSRATSAGLAWIRQLSPSWSLAVKARQRWREDVAGRARATVVGVGLTCAFPGL